MRERIAGVLIGAALTLGVAIAQTPARRPDRVLQAGHSSSVQTVAFSADRRWIASGGFDKTVVIWNAATGDEVRKLSGHTAEIAQVAFSPDSHRLASLGANGNVRIWDVLSGAQIAAINAGGSARHLAYIPDGSGWAVAIDAAKEGATARIDVHNAANGARVRTLSATWSDTDAMTITASGQLVASGSDGDEGTVRIWDVATGQIVSTRTSGARAVSADGTLLADISDAPQTEVVVADMATGRRRQSLRVQNPGAIAFTPDTRAVVITDTSNAQLTVWSLDTNQTRVINGGMADAGLATAAFNVDGTELAAAPYAGNSIKTWSTATGRETHTLFGQSVVQGIAVSPSGQWLAIGSKENLALWDLAAGKRVATLWNGAVSDIAFSRDGRWLAANAGIRFPGETLKVWDMRTRAIAADFSIGTGGSPFQGITFVDSAPAMTTLGPLSKAWSFTADGQQHTLWSASSPVSASAGGKLLAIGEGIAGDVGIWDLQAGRKLTTLRTQAAGLTALAFSPDGRWLMTAGQNGPPTARDRAGNPIYRWTIRLWDAATFMQQWEVPFDATSAPCATFSPDSTRLAVQKSWEAIDVVDVATGMAVGSYAGRDVQPQNHQYSRDDLAFSADGRLLLQGAQNGVRIWTLPK